MQRQVVVQAEDLRKRYGSVLAVDGVSFEVYEGEVFGMVGPNGAGKTTTIECIQGLRYADEGLVRVLGLDPQRDRYILRSRIGVQLQESVLPARIRVWEALDLYASLYPSPVDWLPLIAQVGLHGKRNAFFTTLSGGEKQRLFIALALINDPEVVFLDELTTGLDPQARRAIWDLVWAMRDRGKTVVLTTHLMEEAERLCNRVAIVDHGRIVALDSPEHLIQGLHAEKRVTFIVQGLFDAQSLSGLDGVTRVESDGDRVIVYGKGDGLLGGLVEALTLNGYRYKDLRMDDPTLEDVFLALTGREMRN